MATRLYLTNSGTIDNGFVPANNPESIAYWDTASMVKRPWSTTAGSDTLSTVVTTCNPADGSESTVVAVYCTEVLAAGLTLNAEGLTSLIAQIRAQTSAATGYLEYTLYKYSGAVYTQIGYGLEGDVATASLQNNAGTVACSADTSLSAGDRLLMYITVLNDGGTSQTVSLRIGSNSGQSDLPADSTSLSDLNPYFEFTETMSFGVGSEPTRSTTTNSVCRRNRHN